MFSNLIRPYAHLWYLWALFAWRLLAPLLMRLKHPVSWAMLFAILSGFFYSDALEVYRTLGYLPYFLAGGVVTRQGWREPLRRLCAATDVKVWAVLMLGLHAGMAGYAEHVDLCHGYFEIQGQGKYVDMKCGSARPARALALHTLPPRGNPVSTSLAHKKYGDMAPTNLVGSHVNGVARQTPPLHKEALKSASRIAHSSAESQDTCLVVLIRKAC